MNQLISPRTGLTAATLLLTSLALVPAYGQQASITLLNSDVSFCYRQNTDWTLTKTNDATGPVIPGAQVDWTITATKGRTPGPKMLCAIGFVTVKNTGSAPATIGNIVVDLQRNAGGTKWKEISADVADATHGDAATSANIVAAALQNQTSYPDVVIAAPQATFTENSISDKLEFTDANNNTVWNITPQVSILPGQSVSLIFNASFKADNILPALAAGEQLRTEVFVSFANAGGRGGSGATATNIDIDGNGILDGNVRTVPTRVTRALPALQICNDSVTITDQFATSSTATVNITADPITTGVLTSADATYHVIGTVGGSGTVTNTAYLNGTGSTVTLTTGTDPATLAPITINVPCCVAAHLDASSSVQVTAGTQQSSHCSYTHGAFGAPPSGNNPAQLLAANFASSFPAGLLIGTTPTVYAQWTDLSTLQSWIGGGGPSGALTANTINATSTGGGTLAKQVAALQINVTLGAAVYSSSGIGSLIYTNSGDSLDLKNVSQILAAADTALGTGVLPTAYTFGDLNTLITKLNESFDNCTQSDWALTHLN